MPADSYSQGASTPHMCKQGKHAVAAARLRQTQRLSALDEHIKLGRSLGLGSDIKARFTSSIMNKILKLNHHGLNQSEWKRQILQIF